MTTQFDAQFPDVAETMAKMEAEASVEHETPAQEPSRVAIFIFQTACWILFFTIIFLSFCGLKALWNGFDITQ